MIYLNNEIYYLKTELNLLKGETLDEVVLKGNELNEKLHKRWVMISGEGLVFIGVLFYLLSRYNVSGQISNPLFHVTVPNFTLAV